MSERSGVEWCDSSINPVAGCDGCELRKMGICYSDALIRRYAGRPGWPKAPNKPKRFPGRMARAARWSDLRGTKRPGKPWLDGMPRVIFISDMGDALSKSVPFSFLFDAISECTGKQTGRRHLWLWLTKQSKRLVEFAAWWRACGVPWWPANLGVGVSVPAAEHLPRLDDLLSISGLPLYFASLEPLLEGIALGDRVREAWTHSAKATFCGDGMKPAPRIEWIVTGGASGPKAPACDLANLRGIVRQCRAAAVPAPGGIYMGVPVFVKQVGARPVYHRDDIPDGLWSALEAAGEQPGEVSGETMIIPPPPHDPKGTDPAEWPADLRVRQMPAWHVTDDGGVAWGK